MEFYPSNCQHITFTHKLKPPDHQFELCPTVIEKTTDIKYPGATVDYKLKWNKHADNITAKAIRDIWNMRTWRKTTQPFWDAADWRAAQARTQKAY